MRSEPSRRLGAVALAAGEGKRMRSRRPKVLHDVSGIVQKMGKERGYTLIVEKRGAAVVYGASDADLTDDIVRIFDDESKKAKK